MRWLGLVVIAPALCAATFSSGFRYDLTSWGLAGRFFLPGNFYLNGNGVFGMSSQHGRHYLAYSGGLGAGKMFFIGENVMPLVGVSVGTGTAQDSSGYNNGSYVSYNASRTITTGGRLFAGVALVLFKGFGERKNGRGFSGLTIEAESGILYRYRWEYHNSNYSGRQTSVGAHFYFPDIGGAIYYNW